MWRTKIPALAGITAVSYGLVLDSRRELATRRHYLARVDAISITGNEIQS
jgi:hypothetical protein